MIAGVKVFYTYLFGEIINLSAANHCFGQVNGAGSKEQFFTNGKFRERTFFRR